MGEGAAVRIQGPPALWQDPSCDEKIADIRKETEVHHGGGREVPAGQLLSL